MQSQQKIKILFLCTGNSCRSQMAEGWARVLKPDSIEAWSAGVETHGLNPRAVEAMKESGVDISGQRSKLVEDLPEQSYDYIVTLCGDAHERCPLIFGKGRVLHHGFVDPPTLAAGLTDEDEIMSPYRRVRDEIKTWVESLPESLEEIQK